MTQGQDTLGGAQPITDRVRERILTQRKRKIGRVLLLVTAVSVGMIFVALASRDSQTQRNEALLAGRIAKAFQAEFDATGKPPAHFPELAAAYRDLGRFYEFNVLYPDMVRAAARVGVCAPRQKLPFYLRATGRYIITFDGARYGTAWLSDEDLRAERDRLGFSARLTD